MGRRAFPRILTSLFLSILLAGLVSPIPGSATVALWPTYCDVSGTTSPAGANGHYVYAAGYDSEGRPTYVLGDIETGYRISYMAFGSAPAHWMILGPGDELFSHTSTAATPPATGWTLVNGTGSPAVSCEGGSAPAPTTQSVPTEKPKTPVTYVYGDGLAVNLSCLSTLSFGLTVPGGHMAVFTCPVSGLASNDKLGQDELPGPLPGGTFVSAMDVEIRGVTLTRSPWIVTFQMPEGVSADKLAILYWDTGGKQWVELPALGNPATYQVVDLGGSRKVLTGVHQYTRTHISATVNFTGTFVMIRR
jgi:hypothetical protein